MKNASRLSQGFENSSSFQHFNTTTTTIFFFSPRRGQFEGWYKSAKVSVHYQPNSCAISFGNGWGYCPPPERKVMKLLKTFKGVEAITISIYKPDEAVRIGGKNWNGCKVVGVIMPLVEWIATRFNLRRFYLSS